MEQVRSTKLRDKIIKHLLDNDYNLHQHEDKLNVYFAYTPYDKRLIFTFNCNSIIVVEYINLKKTDIRENKKRFQLVNELNIKSFIMKFAIEKDNILSMETRLQNIYNKKAFQEVLNDIEYDITELLKL